MKILQINSVYEYGSTGKIVALIHNKCKEENIESYVIFARSGTVDGKQKEVKTNDSVFKINNSFEMYSHLALAVLFDKHGLYSKTNTKKIIEKIKNIDPDIIHLHNIHGFYVNYEMLFEYLKKSNKKIVWTLHDCWSFTGFCSHFEYNNCMHWKDQSIKCTCRNVYPYRILINTDNNLKRKIKAFDVENMTLVTPSVWLKDVVKESILNKHECKVINNSIDLSVFKYSKTNYLKEKLNTNKKIILMVSSPFTKQKGFDEALSLSKILSDKYVIVMIGLSKGQIKNLPKNIIGFTRTSDANELVRCYCSSDIFLNLTLEDTYPTVNLEALACGLPVITYKTGGSSEMIEGKGIVVEKYDIEGVKQAIENISLEKKEYHFDNDMVNNYIKLYGELV